MDLALSAEQEMLVDSIGALLASHSTPDVVRTAEPLGFDRPLWDTLCDTGVVEMAIPEATGGWGATIEDLCLLAELVGRHCAPAPVIEAQVAARLLARAGAPAEELLRAVRDDGALATLALHPPTSPVATLVPAGAVADFVLVAAGDTTSVVQTHGGCELVPNHGCLPLADVPLGSAMTLLEDGGAAVELAVDEWLLLAASALVGLASGALDLAVGYAKERRAFGVAIGSFQGIAHRLADAATALDGARLLVRETAWAFDIGQADARERAAAAFAFATDTARDATYWGIHTLGGYGVMVEYDAQLFFRRARGWSGVFGDSERAYRRAAEARYAKGARHGL